MNLRGKFLGEVSALGLPVTPSPLPLVSETDLLALPEPAQRYLRFMGVLGRPRDWSLRACLIGRFKLKQSAPWRRIEAWQYNTSPGVTRTFFMKMRVGGLPILARDTYRDGSGRMLGKLLDRITVIDGSGPEFNVGELVTYLNDLVLLAPSMLLVPAVAWTAADAHSFELSLTDHDNTVKARVLVDDRGAPVDFETTDRFLYDPANPKHLLRTRWTTPVAGFQEVSGRKVPTRAQAVWHPSSGEFPYADFELVPGGLAFNVQPGQ